MDQGGNDRRGVYPCWVGFSHKVTVQSWRWTSNSIASFKIQLPLVRVVLERVMSQKRPRLASSRSGIGHHLLLVSAGLVFIFLYWAISSISIRYHEGKELVKLCCCVPVVIVIAL